MFDSFSESNKATIIAFGSSVVERTIEGTHWFDCLEIALNWNRGRIHHCINLGHSGDTSRDLLARFDRDLTPLKPNITFIKIGGNDTQPDPDISTLEFRSNMTLLVSKLRAIESKVCLMTYHSPISNLYGEERVRKLSRFMEIIREVANSEGTYLIDDLPMWEILREKHPSIHQSLIQDEIHLNKLGNIFLGLSLIKKLNLDISERDQTYWAEAIRIYNLIHGDKINASESSYRT